AEVVGRGVSEPIATIIGVVTTLVGATLLGGAETALLLEGPIGWVIGAVLVGVTYFFGKAAVERAIEPWIRHVRIPSLIKRGVRSRVNTELMVTAQKFEHELHKLIAEAASPLYRAIEALSS